MATITRYLSSRQDNKGMCEINLRITISRTERYRVHSGISIKPSRFGNGKIKIPRIANPEAVELKRIEQSLAEIETALFEYIAAGGCTKDGINATITNYHRPTDESTDSEDSHPQSKGVFFDTYETFMRHKRTSKDWDTQYHNLERILYRYELYKRLDDEKFTLSCSDFDANDFVDFYKREYELYEKHPEIYIAYPPDLRPARKEHKPRKRGHNVVCATVKKLTTFFNWCVKEQILMVSPMTTYGDVKTEMYGKPVYLTIEERDKMYRTEMSDALNKQRDVFMFQCLVGCRISDLYKFTDDNVNDGVLQYIPTKTKNERLDAVTVPLSPTAKKIWEQYEGKLPLISKQRYNDAIKVICKKAGLDRIVTVINPTTGKDERKPIWQVASSHMARRTFIGNLYKKVKDPNLVGALSGHKEGSKAFARYREIDNDIRKDVISLLE